MISVCSARRYTKNEDVSSASSFSQKRCITWFREYTTPDEPDTLGPEGMEKFCEDIGVEPENVVMLVLAYTMNARQMGFFTLSEWLKGFSELQCDSISKVQQKLEYLRNQLNDPHTFKGIYRYAYDFARVRVFYTRIYATDDVSHIFAGILKYSLSCRIKINEVWIWKPRE